MKALVNKEGEHKMTDEFIMGFCDKCAEMDVDPVELVKTAVPNPEAVVNRIVELIGSGPTVGQAAKAVGETASKAGRGVLGLLGRAGKGAVEGAKNIGVNAASSAVPRTPGFQRSAEDLIREKYPNASSGFLRGLFDRLTGAAGGAGERVRGAVESVKGVGKDVASLPATAREKLQNLREGLTGEIAGKVTTEIPMRLSREIGGVGEDVAALGGQLTAAEQAILRRTGDVSRRVGTARKDILGGITGLGGQLTAAEQKIMENAQATASRLGAGQAGIRKGIKGVGEGVAGLGGQLTAAQGELGGQISKAERSLADRITNLGRQAALEQNAVGRQSELKDILGRNLGVVRDDLLGLTGQTTQARKEIDALRRMQNLLGIGVGATGLGVGGLGAERIYSRMKEKE